MATLTQFASQYRLSFLAVSVGTSGSSATNDTGLNGVYAAAAVVLDTNQSASDAGYVTLNYATTSGNVAVYCWDDAGAAAANASTVHIIAIGT